MSVPLPGENIPIWGSYLRALRARPILVKALTSSVAMTTAEYISHGWYKIRKNQPFTM